MSSFTIGKAEYIKAAGVIAGIVEGTSFGRNEVYIYDYQKSKKMTADDFYNCFVECFEMNALSVYEQYKERHPEDVLDTDTEPYTEEFKEYQKIGRNALLDPEKLCEIIFNLRDFLKSAEYQTEKEAYFFKMKMIFNEILVQLMGLLYPHECECWGDFNA